MAFLLEPDLKESHGGLRDVNVLRAVAAYAPLLADYVNLASLEPAAAVLDRGPGRAAPQMPGGSSTDCSSKNRTTSPRVLAYGDADELMAAVSTAGRAIAWVSDDAWRRRRLWQPEGPAGGGAAAGDRGHHEGHPACHRAATAGSSSRASRWSAARWP